MECLPPPLLLLETPGNNVKYGCLCDIFVGNKVAQTISPPVGWFWFSGVMGGLIPCGSGAVIVQKQQKHYHQTKRTASAKQTSVYSLFFSFSLTYLSKQSSYLSVALNPMMEYMTVAA